MLLHRQGAGDHAFAGSCFSARDSTVAFTAAHCVKGLPADRLAVTFPRAHVGTDEPVRVSDVVLHPTSDVALLRLEVEPWSLVPFYDFHEGRGLGSDVVAFGFPENVFSEGGEPTERVFRGHIQRQFAFHAPDGYTYDAIELSFGCPAGLSGGAVAQWRQEMYVIGVAAANFESTTTLDAIEERTRGGETVTTRYARILTYGLAVHGGRIAEWVNDQLPPLTIEEWQTRQA